MLSREEKKELLELAGSAKLREDMEKVRKNRHNPFIVKGRIDTDRVLEFLMQYNEFINHEPRPFRRIVCKDMRI